MSLTLYIAFDKIIIKSVFQPLEKSFKSVFSAISEWCAHTGQASQYFRKAVFRTSLARSVLQPFALLPPAALITSRLRSAHDAHPHPHPHTRLPNRVCRESLWAFESLSQTHREHFQLPSLPICALTSCKRCRDHEDGRHLQDTPAYSNQVFLFGSYNPS